jgi:hypothetical protein
VRQAVLTAVSYLPGWVGAMEVSTMGPRPIDASPIGASTLEASRIALQLAAREL